MQKKIKRYLLTLKLSLIAIGVGPSFLALIPIADFTGTAIQKMLAYCIGVFFWLFTIIGYTWFVLSNRQRENISKRLSINRKYKSKIGILCFFTTFEGAIIDIVMILSLILLVIVLIFQNETTWHSVATIILLLSSVQLHCILNGENFKYSKFIQSRRVKNVYENEN